MNKKDRKRFTYSEQLEAHGWTDSLIAFEDILADEAANLCRGLSSDAILVHFRRFALPLIKSVIQKTGLTGKPVELEELVSAILLNNRKRNKERARS